MELKQGIEKAREPVRSDVELWSSQMPSTTVARSTVERQSEESTGTVDLSQETIQESTKNAGLKERDSPYKENAEDTGFQGAEA